MSSLRAEQTEVGMTIDWDVPIETDDGVLLRADVFRPVSTGRYPVLLSYGPYGKGLAFQDAYAPQWNYMVDRYPEVAENTSNRYQNWEVVDPEKWVPDGYVCVRVDSRGAGRSPGYLDVWSQRETLDLYQCIEWAGEQPWSSGKVGLAGISYYAMNQYQVAALQPPHLFAICPWEGASDFYRELARHGGILCQFAADWYPRQVATVQHGVGDRGFVSAMNGDLVAGPETLPEDTLQRQRADLGSHLKETHLLGPWHEERNPDWQQVTVPMLSAGNWGGHGLHLRGNIEAYTRAASRNKWLEVHTEAHWVDFYTNRGVSLQKAFFDHYLKDEDNGWDQRPPIHLRVRNADGSVMDRFEGEWPLERTQWTKYRLTTQQALATQEAKAGSLEYDAGGDGITFMTGPFEANTEITGPIAAKLFISSTTVDTDLFLILRLFDPGGEEVTFMGALDPNTPLAQGWLRASHRELDPDLSHFYRPYHRHHHRQLLEPGEIYEVDVEVWPTSIAVPAGYSIGLTIKGNDYHYDGELSDFAKEFHYANRGIGPFVHDDPDDRPPDIFHGSVTIHVGDQTDSHLLLPIVP